MLCKLCNKDVERKFGCHLNRHHSIGGGHRGHALRMTIKRYFELFPEQREEYENKKKGSWCKGLTKETSSVVAKIAAALKEHCSQECVRKQRSERMKKRYEHGDIISKEQRAIVVKKGSDGWVKKLKSLSNEERKEALKKFTSAGNMAQQKRREFLTPEDYQRLYPFAKGKAAYCNCKYCGKQMIGWFGGKPRPANRFCSNSCLQACRQNAKECLTPEDYQKFYPRAKEPIYYSCGHCGKQMVIRSGNRPQKNMFCNNDCWHNYMATHPCYVFPHVRRYYSTKMNVEFYLHSKIEEWIAKILDENNCILSWSTTPFVIYYYSNGKKRRYYPDFFINEKYILEVKSGYFFNLDKQNVLLKIEAAEHFCEEYEYNYLYWQFDKNNLRYNDVVSDLRVIDFLKQEQNEN